MTTTVNFEFGGAEYRIDKLSAFQQFHLSRRIAPLVPALVPAFLQIARTYKTGAKKSDAEKSAEIERLAPLFQPFADGMAQMKDADAEYVISTCLSSVKKRSADAWLPIWMPGQGRVMFEDLNDVGSIMQLVFQCIKANLGNFISGLLTSQIQSPEAQAGIGANSPVAKTGSFSR